jgi:hypothetical protein
MGRKPKRLKENVEDDKVEAETIEVNNQVAAAVPLKKIEIIEKWTYLLDEETGYFKYPVIPDLDDCVINKYINDKSTKSCQIYTCPYCKRIFTYSLCFKTHLYTCQNSPHCEHLYLCSYTECTFSSAKKQIVIQHYTTNHLNTITNKAGNKKPSSKAAGSLKACFEKSNYLYVNGMDYQLAFDFYKYCNTNFCSLEMLDLHLKDQTYSKYK